MQPLNKVLIGCAAVWLIALGSWLVWEVQKLFFHPIPYPFDQAVFSAEIWEQGGMARGPMVDDLIKNVLKPGMAEAEVVALLGETPDTPWGSDAYYIGAWDVEEYVDSSWVVMDYTPGRVLEGARIRHIHY